MQLGPAVGSYFEERHKTLLVSTQSALDVSPACQRSAAHTQTHTKPKLNSLKHKQQKARSSHTHFTAISVNFPFLTHPLNFGKLSSCLSKSLQAPDSCGIQTNDFIWLFPHCSAILSSSGSAIILPLSPVLPATPDPTPGLSRSCFTAHSC